MIKNRVDKLKINSIADKAELSRKEVEEIVLSQFSFIREKTGDMDLPKGLTRREFDNIKTNFNIPCIGKLYANYFVYKRINKANEEDNKKS